MTRDYLYNIWAPPGGLWSDWCKPVLFAHLTREFLPTEGMKPLEHSLDWVPAADGSTAIVIDLPGPASIGVAMQLARVGYRPVPLFNALPSEGLAAAVCDIRSILITLAMMTPELDGLNLPFHAPPAFVLDADRRAGNGRLTPGMFDNRSVSLPTDFPSANLLLSRGIKQAILVQYASIAPQEDLAHTLLRWQRAGIAIAAADLMEAPPVTPQPIDVPRPPRFKTLWQRLLAVAGLRRHPQGGFGAILPIPTSSSGG